MRDLLSHYHTTALTVAALFIAAGVVLAAVAVRMFLARRRPEVVVAEIVHVGATERWSPMAQTLAVPHKPLGPEEARRVAEDHEAAIWEDQQRELAAAFRDFEDRFPRAIDDTFAGLIRRAERIGHLERNTCEIPRELMLEVVARSAGR